MMVRQRVCLLVGLVCLCCPPLAVVAIPPGATVFTWLQAGKPKCYYEELPKDTLIQAKYSTERVGPPLSAAAATQIIGLRVFVTDPEGNSVLDKMTDLDGRVVVTTRVGGEHKLCFQTNTSRWFGPNMKFRFFIVIDTGVAAVDYGELAKKQSLNSIQTATKRVNDRVKEVIEEQSYQRNREFRFRDTSDSTARRVIFWACMQLVLLVGLAFWQLTHLKAFFKSKKLV